TSASVTSAPGSASSPFQHANAEAERYGEPCSSGGPSGSICHHDCPAAASQSTKRYASSPRRPPGSEGGCSRTPLERLAGGKGGYCRDGGQCPEDMAPETMPAKQTAKTPPRIRITNVKPLVDCGRHPAWRSVGNRVDVQATVFRDGHEILGAQVLYRGPGEKRFRSAPLELLWNDLFLGSFEVDAVGHWEFRIEALSDRAATWRDELRRKVEAGDTELASELAEGAALLGVKSLTIEKGLASTKSDKHGTVQSDPLQLYVDRPLGRYGAWYELFPRSFGGFAGVEQVLPQLAELGFDVVYFPPIHPIGRSGRKSANNTPPAKPGDPGSPWAIRSGGGGPHAHHPPPRHPARLHH